MIYGLTKERAKDILKTYSEGKKELFNWCDEYKQFINSCVNGCLSMEVEYMLKRSFEDQDSALSYDDLDLFDLDKTLESITYEVENQTEEEIKTLFDETNQENNLRIKTVGDYEVYLNSLDKDSLRDLADKFNLDTDQTNGEVFEWWLISDPLKYRLEQQNEIFISGACVDFWGRQTTGQSISLDYCCIKAFIELLKDIIK